MKESGAVRSIGGDIDRRGNCVVFWGAWYLPDLRVWEPRATIVRSDGDYGELSVPFCADDYCSDESRAGMLGRQRAFELIDSGHIDWGAPKVLAA